MFVMVQKNRGPTLNMARSLINMPNGQALFDSGCESESYKKMSRRKRSSRRSRRRESPKTKKLILTARRVRTPSQERITESTSSTNEGICKSRPLLGRWCESTAS